MDKGQIVHGVAPHPRAGAARDRSTWKCFRHRCHLGQTSFLGASGNLLHLTEGNEGEAVLCRGRYRPRALAKCCEMLRSVASSEVHRSLPLSRKGGMADEWALCKCDRSWRNSSENARRAALSRCRSNHIIEDALCLALRQVSMKIEPQPAAASKSSYLLAIN